MTGNVTSIRGNSDKICEANKDMPKILLFDLLASATDTQKEEKLKERCKEARLSYLAQRKVRRDEVRAEPCSRKAETFNIKSGLYKSWGYTAYDEYFGGLNDSGQCHGEGVKFYSDGSTYAGC